MIEELHVIFFKNLLKVMPILLQPMRKRIQPLLLSAFFLFPSPNLFLPPFSLLAPPFLLRLFASAFLRLPGNLLLLKLRLELFKPRLKRRGFISEDAITRTGNLLGSRIELMLCILGSPLANQCANIRKQGPDVIFQNFQFMGLPRKSFFL